MKRPESNNHQRNPIESQGSRFQSGAYRMVFSNKKAQSTHHNKLNLRDTSAEPSNIFGDTNLPSTLRDEDFDNDLNDRQPPVDENLISELPPLEIAHVPHHERRARAAVSQSKKNLLRASNSGNTS